MGMGFVEIRELRADSADLGLDWEGFGDFVMMW